MKQQTVNQKHIEDVLRRYSRAVVHMREQKKRGRFGLILGSGASLDLKFPDWNGLIKRIASHTDINAPHLVRQNDSHASQAQLLFGHLETIWNARFSGSTDVEKEIHKSRMKAAWHDIIRDCLYKDVPTRPSDLRKKDKYLSSYLPVIQGQGVTINYNFDDSLQVMIEAARDEIERQQSRGYKNILNTELPISDYHGVIYHPNGYLPRRKAERASEELIFQKKEFVKAEEEGRRGRYASLSHYLAQTTRLLIGLSLDDTMLQNLLRQSAENFPGHCHYRVEFVDRKEPQDTAALRQQHWEHYNVITLFLRRAEIAALGQLLTMSDEEFSMAATKIGVPVFRFYLTGAVAVGKSTAVSHFYSLRTHDEWLDMRLDGMEKDPSLVPSARLEIIDRWLADQFHRKNHILSRAESGIDIVDRSPLDPFGFTEPKDWRRKAHLLRSTIAPDTSNARLCDGTVILLRGDTGMMAARAIAKNKETSPELLAKQQDLLSKVFEPRGPGVRVIGTQTQTRAQVAKEIATLIYFEEVYTPGPMHEWLRDLESGQITYDQQPTLFD